MEGKRAYALIVVLWSIVILTIIFVNLIDEAELNSLLLRNNLQRRELRSAAVDGVMRGIASLREDETKADAGDEAWAKVREFKPSSRISTEVKISDLGSKLNINYRSRAAFVKLAEELDWAEIDWKELSTKLVWERDVENEEEKLGLISNLALLREEFESKADYQQTKELFTTYGCFNPNLYQAEAAVQLLYFLKEKLDLTTLSQALILDIGAEVSQGEHKGYDSVQGFLEEALPTSPYLREKIAPYLTVKPRININFVSAEVLALILSNREEAGSDYKKRAEKIVTYCREHRVKNLDQLNKIGVGIISPQLKGYLTTSSSYLLITVRALNQKTGQEEKIEAVVHKRWEDEESKVQIVDWREE